jgi:hypothetical protein
MAQRNQTTRGRDAGAADAAGGRRPLVFLSHSGYEGPTKDALQSLEHALTQDGFTPLIDRSIVVPGTSIQRNVRMMLETCDACVVVMNRRAFENHESTWVFNEVSALRLRTDPDFQILTLYVEDVTVDKVRADPRWAPPALAELAATTTTGDPEEDARAVVAMLEPTKRRVEAGAIALELQSILEGLGIRERNLARIGRALSGRRRAIAGDPFVEVPRLLVRCVSYKAIREFVQEIAILDVEVAHRVLDLVLPFLWVHREAAAEIPRGVAERRLIGIAASRPETTEAYVHCGSPVYPPWQVREVAAGFDGLDLTTIAADAEDALKWVAGRYEFGGEDDDEEPDEQHLQDVVILAVPFNGFDAEVVRTLLEFLDEQPKVGVVLQGGRRPDAGAAHPKVLYLQPEMKPDRETRGLELMRVAHDHLKVWQDKRRRSRGTW